MGIFYWSVLGIVVFSLLCVLFWRVWFLRKPSRIIPKGGVLVSPAMGKVVNVIHITKGIPGEVGLDKGILGKISVITKDVVSDGFLVSIMLTPLDVHFQRAPLDGTVVSVKYTRGRFKNAMVGAGSFGTVDNERNEIVVEDNDKRKVKVVQVAGVLARRVKCFVRPGDRVVKGDVIGLIDLGSQVNVVVPCRDLLVGVGDKVIDGETVIGRL
jgi:phosphatidylserine decarboxylase